MSPAFLFAVFLWPTVKVKTQQLIAQQNPRFVAHQQAVNYALNKQQKMITLSRRYSTVIREIWDLQHRLLKRQPFMLHRLIHHPRFRAAFDFLLLRTEIKEVDSEIATWWIRFLDADEMTRKKLIHAATLTSRETRGPRKRGRTL